MPATTTGQLGVQQALQLIPCKSHHVPTAQDTNHTDSPCSRCPPGGALQARFPNALPLVASNRNSTTTQTQPTIPAKAAGSGRMQQLLNHCETQPIIPAKVVVTGDQCACGCTTSSTLWPPGHWTAPALYAPSAAPAAWPCPDHAVRCCLERAISRRHAAPATPQLQPHSRPRPKPPA
jgi:hypothetical protein